MTIHKSINNEHLLNRELIQALATYLQANFPNLDIWCVKNYTADTSSEEAKIHINSTSGHIGIGKKPQEAEKASHVLMKVYNVESEVWTFFFDQPRIEKIGLDIQTSKICDFGKCNLEKLQAFFDANSEIINSINQITPQHK